MIDLEKILVPNGYPVSAEEIRDEIGSLRAENERPREVLTLRDYFAAAALTGILANNSAVSSLWNVEKAYEHADLMLKQRDEITSLRAQLAAAEEEIESLKAQVTIAKQSNGFTLLAEDQLQTARKAMEDLIICAEQVTDEDGNIRPHAQTAITNARRSLTDKGDGK